MADNKEQRVIEIILKAQDANASLKEMGAGAAVMTAQLSKMGQDDPGRARLLADLQTMNQRLAASRAEMRLVVKSEEELAAEAQAAAAATEELARANEQTVASGKKVTSSLNEMKAAAQLMEKQLLAMSQDDPNRAALQRDFTQLTQRIGDANAMLRTHIKTQQELATEEAAAAAAAAKLNQENLKVVVDGQKVNATFNQMKASAAQLEKQLGDLSHDDPGRAKMLADYKALGQRIEEVKDEMGQTVPKANLFKEALSFAGVALTAEAAVSGIIELGKSVFEATAKFEKYEAVMTNALGDKSKAQQAMKDIQLMAAQTPFSVDELTGSFIKFVNRGLNPSMAEMTKMADLAASQGKSFDQLTEAVLDAGGGEFERLKEFGIKASKSGDQVSLSFKGVNQVVKNTPEAINGAIMAFGGMQGVAGSTAAISRTLEGQLSNLGDTADMLKTKVGGGLSPVFSLLLTLFSNFLGWIGRFVEEAKPLGTLFTEIGTIMGDFYHEIGDVLESLGLFSSKTDTVKFAVEALKVGLTLLLIPFRIAFGAAKGLVDAFVNLYNRSELLRGVLGGLGAVIIGLFLMIKDDALKILGGVGDIIIGIFTLDKNRIVAGFKSAMSATADVMLEGGNRAAEQFKKGFEANKNNNITRTVRVKTETDGPDATPVGDKLTSTAGTGDAAAAKKAAAAAKKAKADQDKADQERLNDLKRWVKEEGDVLEGRDVLTRARDAAANTDELKRRELQRQKLFDAATKQVNALTGQEADYTDRVKAIVEERDLQLRELKKSFDEKDAQERQQKLDKQLADEAADEDVEKAALEAKRADGLVTEQQYQDQLYELTRDGLKKRLALLVAAGQGESGEAKKLQAALLKGEAEHTSKGKKLKQDELSFELKVAGQGASLLKEGLQLVEDHLDKKSAAYKAFKAARKAAEIAEIGINLAAEIQAIWKAASENPFNGITAGAAGTAQGVLQTGLAVARAAGASIKVAAFAAGGRTDGGRPVALAPWAGLLSGASGGSLAPGGSFAGGGPVQQATVGLIGEAGAELVIPNWLYADPKQANLMGFLEAQIASRGNAFATGGSTTGSSPVVATEAATSGQLVELLQQLVKGQQEFRDELTDWQRNLVVQNNLVDVDRGLKTVQQVKRGGGIR